MVIEELQLHDFRNYRETQIAFPPGVTLIKGENGQGKTNLLEAIYFLAYQKSWRSPSEAVLIREGCTSARIDATIQGAAGRKRRIGMGLGNDRRCVVDNKLCKGRKELTGLVSATLFAPDDLELVKGPPEKRRNFIDESISRLRPGRAHVVSDYARVLRQRNGLLKSASWSGERALGTLEIWDEQLVEKGVALVRARVAALKAIMNSASKIYSSACGGGRETLEAEYECSFAGDKEIEEALRVALRSVQKDEIRRGITLAGPHRDDIRFTIGGLDARTKSSQGEQRTAALSIRLAEHDCVREIRGEEGILLLDDVFSELDPVRSELLTGRLGSAQAVITSAGILPEEIYGHSEAIYAVEGGRVRQAA